MGLARVTELADSCRGGDASPGQLQLCSPQPFLAALPRALSGEKLLSGWLSARPYVCTEGKLGRHKNVIKRLMASCSCLYPLLDIWAETEHLGSFREVVQVCPGTSTLPRLGARNPPVLSAQCQTLCPSGDKKHPYLPLSEAGAAHPCSFPYSLHRNRLFQKRSGQAPSAQQFANPEGKGHSLASFLFISLIEVCR